MPYYYDWWYEDLPEGAKKAAAALGYTKESWDDDSNLPYESKSFQELTMREKKAMMYLGVNPISNKLDVWWSEVDEETQKMAEVLGWTAEKWDDDWEIYHLPCEHWNWDDMTDEQRAAGAHFGYTKPTWDYTVDGVNYEEEEGDDAPAPAAAASKPSAPSEPDISVPPACGDGDGKGGDDGDDAGAGASEPAKKQKKKKKGFKMSKFYGGDGGDMFDHRNHRRIHEITFYTGQVVDGFHIKYEADEERDVGGKGGLLGKDVGAKSHKVELEKGEYITKVFLRARNVVQAIGLTTNKNRTFGPFGGKGRIARGEKAGEESEIEAPLGYQLCGFAGRAGSNLDAIALRWGPIPAKK